MCWLLWVSLLPGQHSAKSMRSLYLKCKIFFDYLLFLDNSGLVMNPTQLYIVYRFPLVHHGP